MSDLLETLPALESLRCFLEAARTLNFRAAAHTLSLTPAALGQRIRKLEAEVGATLFQRTTRSVALTGEGLALVPYARRAVEAAAECLRAGRGELGAAPMELVVGTRHELGLSWIVPMLPSLARTHPHLTLHLYFGSGQDLLLRVRTREIDVSISSARVEDPKLASLTLHAERYCFVGARRLLARNPLRSAAQARGHVLLDIGVELPLFHYWRHAPGGFDSLEFARVQRLGTIAAIRALVLRGAGVAVLPEYYVRSDLERRRLVRILPTVEPLVDAFRLVFRADDPRRSVYEALAASMRRVPLR